MAASSGSNGLTRSPVGSTPIGKAYLWVGGAGYGDRLRFMTGGCGGSFQGFDIAERRGGPSPKFWLFREKMDFFQRPRLMTSAINPPYLAAFLALS